MNCASCGAPMQAVGDGFQCPFCHAVAFAEQNDEGVRLLGASDHQTCPLCAVPLQDATLAGVRLGYCTTCRGMALGMDIFAALIDTLRAAPATLPAARGTDTPDLHRTLLCPRCRHAMTSDWYAGGGHVVIDSCEPCSLLWLDHGELMQIAHAPDSMRETAQASF